YDTHGWALSLSGAYDEAIPMLLRALNTNEFVQGYYHLAETHRRNGDLSLMQDAAALGVKLLEKPLQQGENVTDETREKLREWAGEQAPTS
ncbi:MAG: hypothetical protein AAF743_10070, partial [Planctomycetota bacterium]